MNEYRGLGRRKNAVARVRVLSPGSGKITVNSKTLEEFFPVEILQKAVRKPLQIVDQEGAVDLYILCHGGGITGQAGAAQLGVARALVRMDEAMKESLRPAGVMTRDPRMVERKKYGRKKARKRFQFSKR